MSRDPGGGQEAVLGGKVGLPEDDGMGALRRRLREIQERDVTADQKALLMHRLLMESYRRSTKAKSSTSEAPLPLSLAEAEAEAEAESSEDKEKAWEESLAQGRLELLKFWPSTAETFTLTEEDVKPTFAVEEHDSPGGSGATRKRQRRLGCAHYLRNVKMQCSRCSKWYTCRFCHDAAEDHALNRRETRNMLCMLCGCPQRASEACVRCGATAARYYCGVCKLWDDHPDKPIYHCADCGICRRGTGLGKDFFHCKTCCACISIKIESSHKCIERSTDCDCPICGEYLFTSPKSVVFMGCGHSIHEHCYEAYIETSYKCPICNKSLFNMEYLFRNLEATIQHQPMPPQFQDTRAVVLCNDCSARSTVPYHWLGLKCAICTSYNTVQLQVLGRDQHRDLPPVDPMHPGRAGYSRGMHGPPRPMPMPMPAPAPAFTTRLARSRSPSHAVMHEPRDPLEVVSAQALGMESDEDSSDDNILGFWGREHRRRGESDDDSSGSEGDEEDEDEDEDEDDDEGYDEDDDLILIGHR